MKTLTNDDIFERLDNYYTLMSLLRQRGAILNGSRPIDIEYAHLHHEAMEYIKNFPEEQKRVTINLLGLVARIHGK